MNLQKQELGRCIFLLLLLYFRPYGSIVSTPGKIAHFVINTQGAADICKA